MLCIFLRFQQPPGILTSIQFSLPFASPLLKEFCKLEISYINFFLPPIEMFLCFCLYLNDKQCIYESKTKCSFSFIFLRLRNGYLSLNCPWLVFWLNIKCLLFIYDVLCRCGSLIFKFVKSPLYEFSAISFLLFVLINLWVASTFIFPFCCLFVCSVL